MLNEILTLDIYRFFMIFARFGAALMLMPGFGGRISATRVRLTLALVLSLVMLPVVGSTYPSMPTEMGGLLLMLLGEVLVGLFLGLLLQVVMAALHLTGTFIGFQVGMTNAFSFDSVAEQQSSILTGFLNVVAITLIFAVDLHHAMLRGIVDSYVLFAPGAPLPLDDFATTLAQTLAASFTMGIRLGAPFVAFALVFYGALGLLAKLSPQIQVFFVALPLQIAIGLWFLIFTMPLMYLMFLRYFEDSLFPFLIGG